VWQGKSIRFDKDETARGQDDNEALRGERSDQIGVSPVFET